MASSIRLCRPELSCGGLRHSEALNAHFSLMLISKLQLEARMNSFFSLLPFNAMSFWSGNRRHDPLLYSQVNSAGELQIRLVSFTNPDSLLADGGRCCQTPNSIGDATCTGPCRTFFRVCAAADGAGIPLQSSVRISRLRSRRGRRSPGAVPQQYTDTAVPSGLPSIGDEEELLPAEHRVAEEPSRGTSIQVIHHLISTAEEEPTRGAPHPPTGRSTAQDTEPQVFPLEESAAPPADTVTGDSPAAEENPTTEETTTSRPPLQGSALVGRPPSQHQPDGPQDIGLVFVEDKGYIHLYFQPKKPRTRRRANGGSAGDPPRRNEPPPLDNRQRRSVGVAIRDSDITDNLEHAAELDDPSLNEPEDLIGTSEGSDEPEDLTGTSEGSGSEESQEQDKNVGVQPISTRSGEDARREGASPLTTAECPLGVLFTGVVTTNGSLESVGQISFPFDTPWTVSDVITGRRVTS